MNEFREMSVDEKIEYIEDLLGGNLSGSAATPQQTPVQKKQKLTELRGLDLTDEIKEEISEKCYISKHLSTLNVNYDY